MSEQIFKRIPKQRRSVENAEPEKQPAEQVIAEKRKKERDEHIPAVQKSSDESLNTIDEEVHEVEEFSEELIGKMALDLIASAEELAHEAEVERRLAKAHAAAAAISEIVMQQRSAAQAA
jgi:hypothetical protein